VVDVAAAGPGADELPEEIEGRPTHLIHSVFMLNEKQKSLNLMRDDPPRRAAYDEGPRGPAASGRRTHMKGRSGTLLLLLAACGAPARPPAPAAPATAAMPARAPVPAIEDARTRALLAARARPFTRAELTAGDGAGDPFRPGLQPPEGPIICGDCPLGQY